MIKNIIYSILTTIISSYFILQDGINSTEVLEIIHFFIIVISSFSIFSYRNNSFSLYKTFHLFNLFFAGIAPIVQYKNNISFWGSSPMTESEYLKTSILYLAAIIIYNIIYYKRYKTIKIQNKRIISFIGDSSAINLSESKQFLLIIISCFSLFMLLKLNNFNIISLLFRGGSMKEMSDASKMETLLITSFFRPMSILLFLFVLNFTRKIYLKIILFILAILCASPTGMARYMAATLYMPLLLSIPFFRRKNIYTFSFIIGLLIIFPAMTVFRNYQNNFELSFFNPDIFMGEDFDSFYIFAQILKYEIITYGRQLLGVLLFWFPRSIWADKPVGSGQFLAEQSDYFFTNISCNFFGEGYINFGIIGIIVFAIILAYITSIIDKYYWTVNSGSTKMTHATLLYIILTTVAFIFFRGDMMCTVATMTGYAFTYLVVYKILKS